MTREKQGENEGGVTGGTEVTREKQGGVTGGTEVTREKQGERMREELPVGLR